MKGMDQTPAGASYRFEAIGTSWAIDIDDALAGTEADALSVRIRARIEAFEATYSRFRPDSLVAKIAERAGTYVFPEDAGPLFALYESLYRLSDGRVTPLIGQVLAEAGYDAAYSLAPKAVRTRPPSWEEALSFLPPRTLVTKRPALLDFGAIGKGYLIDLVGDLLRDAGIRSYRVDAGGDMIDRREGGGALLVGLEDPRDPSRAVGIARLANAGLCGSAGNRRAWRGFNHIMDPTTLASPQGIAAVWTWASSAALADAMATGLFFVEPAKLRAAFPFEFLILHADRHLEGSPAFPAETFT